jgi:hypothetical protein
MSLQSFLLQVNFITTASEEERLRKIAASMEDCFPGVKAEGTDVLTAPSNTKSRTRTTIYRQAITKLLTQPKINLNRLIFRAICSSDFRTHSLPLYMQVSLYLCISLSMFSGSSVYTACWVLRHPMQRLQIWMEAVNIL